MPDIDKKIVEILQPDFMKFYAMLMKEEEFPKMLEDPACEGEDDIVYFLNCYLQGILEHKKGLTLLYKKIVGGGYCKKKTNRFLYQLLKLKHKTKYKLWSWNEMIDFNIDYDPSIKTTTNYTID